MDVKDQKYHRADRGFSARVPSAATDPKRCPQMSNICIEPWSNYISNHQAQQFQQTNPGQEVGRTKLEVTAK